MKLNLLLLSLSLLTVACVKTESKKVKMPVIKKADPFKITKKGLRCDLIGWEDTKEVFLEVSKKGDKTKINFYDFQDDKRITITGAVIDGFQMIAFNMNSFDQEAIQGGNAGIDPLPVITGESAVIKTKEAIIILSDDEEQPDRQVIATTATLQLDENNNGNIHFIHTLKSDSGIEKMNSHSVQIDNCEAFEATYL